MIKKMTTIRIMADKEKEQMHDNPLFPCSSYCIEWNRGGIQSLPWHWHRELEFMYVASGRAVVEYAGKRAIVEAGNGFFCNSRVLHRYALDGERCQLYCILFDEKFISGGIANVIYKKYVKPIVTDEMFSGKYLHTDVKRERDVIINIRRAFIAAQKEIFGFELDLRYNIGKALAILSDHPTASRIGYTTPQMERIKVMLDYIHGHYSEQISVEELAAQAGISEREAQRCFQSIFNMSPRQYIQNYRLQVAEEMLLESNESILSIGMACGYYNPSHFSKAFRLYRGCSPHAFRKQNS